MYFPHFYSDKFYKGNQIEEKCQISLLLNKSAKTIQSPTMELPQHLSVGPRVFFDFFPNRVPLLSTFPVGGKFWHLSASPLPSIFGGNSHLWVGIPQYLSTEPHSVSRP